MLALVIIGLVVAAVVVAKYKWKGIVAEAGAEQQYVADRGYELVRANRPAPDATLDLFTAVSDRMVKTTIERTGSPDSVFTYRFDVVHNGVEEKRWMTCALVQLPFGAPKTLLRPHTKQTVPPTPTDGSDLPLGPVRFDELFRLQATDEDFARSLFNDDLVSWLMTDEVGASSIEFEFRGQWLLCAGPRIDDAEQMIDLLEFAQALRDLATTAVT